MKMVLKICQICYWTDSVFHKMNWILFRFSNTFRDITMNMLALPKNMLVFSNSVYSTYQTYFEIWYIWYRVNFSSFIMTIDSHYSAYSRPGVLLVRPGQKPGTECITILISCPTTCTLIRYWSHHDHAEVHSPPKTINWAHYGNVYLLRTKYHVGIRHLDKPCYPAWLPRWCM